MKHAPLKIWFDGGARPNPGRMETAFVVAGQLYLTTDAGHGDSLTAEWLALQSAVRYAAAQGTRDVLLLGDCAAVLGVAAGRIRPRGQAKTHFAAYSAIVAPIPRVRLRQVPREHNLAGIALARQHPR